MSKIYGNTTATPIRLSGDGSVAVTPQNFRYINILTEQDWALLDTKEPFFAVVHSPHLHDIILKAVANGNADFKQYKFSESSMGEIYRGTMLVHSTPYYEMGDDYISQTFLYDGKTYRRGVDVGKDSVAYYGFQELDAIPSWYEKKVDKVNGYGLVSVWNGMESSYPNGIKEYLSINVYDSESGQNLEYKVYDTSQTDTAISNAIGDVNTALENIIAKYGLGGDVS